MTMIETDVFCTLRARLTGSLVTRSDGYWDVARAAWVLNVDQRPSAVVHAETAQDVAETVAFAASNGLRLVLRGAGSDAASQGGLSGTILLDISPNAGIGIDAEGPTARVEAGVL
jgi:FAD/FMN-containing dehydrogenase